MTEEPRKPGRPKGSSDSKKIKLKPSPKTAKEDYAKKYGDIGLVAIYGVDDFTKELIYYLWNDPKQEFVVTDPVDQYLANLTKEIGNRPYSLYRYEAVRHVGFVESGHFPVIVVASKYWEEVKKLPNPEKVELVNLELWK